MLVTVNTDASFHPELKCGAYAFWAVCNEFKITKSGIFKTRCMNPDDAEARCIVNALKIILMNHKGITKVIVNTDSLNAIAILNHDIKHMKRYLGNSIKMWKPVVSAYNKILRDSTKKHSDIEFRHVKAHTGANDKRSYVNEWADAEAKRQLRSIQAVINFNKKLKQAT